MIAPRKPIRIGTRGSPLALYQANAVIAALRGVALGLDEPEAFEIVVIRTTGDKVQDRRLAELGGKALFTQEIERALTEGEIDMAVHSAKDVDTHLAPGTVLAAVLPREDRRDVLIAPKYGSVAALPKGGRVGTVSLRRQSQVLMLRPDLEVVLFRGNVETRLRKVAEGEVDGTFLALAGLKRLGLESAATAILETSEMLPAAGQGAITVQARADDIPLLSLVTRISDPVSAAEVRAERAALARLGGSCDTPIAAMAIGAASGNLTLKAKVFRPDGSQVWSASAAGGLTDATDIGTEVGSSLQAQCDPELLLPPANGPTASGTTPTG